MVSIFENTKPQMNADERRFVESGIEHIFSDSYGNLINLPQRAQRLFLPFEFESEKILQQRNGTRMTRIARIFTDNVDPCESASSAQSVFYYIPSCTARASAFIGVMPASVTSAAIRRHVWLKPYVDSPRGWREAVHRHVCPCGGIRGGALQRRDSGRLHLRLNNRVGGA